MNIAFDAVAILGPMSKNRGIGNYALSQFTKMIDNDSDNHYYFFNLIEKDFQISSHVRHPERVTEFFIDTGSSQVLLRSPEYADVVGTIIKRWLSENNIDIFYITSPFESNFTVYRREWFEGVRTVATVYDIIPYVMKEKYLTDKNVISWYMECVDSLRWQDRLLVISESVKTDMVKYLNFSPENIDIIWGAVDECYRKTEISDEDKSALLNKFGVNREFIMCTGGEDDRKNLDGLIRSYALLPENLRSKYQLVIVCKLSENGLKRLSDVASKSGVSADVVFTNFVTAEELLYFYNLAVFLAFPSKYEGFGLPIVEAWACGTPVLTSDNSSLAQIGGSAAVLVDADSDKSIAAGMQELLENPDKLAEYTRLGEERLELYRWDKVADAAIEILNSVTPYPAATESVPAEEKRHHIAMFTPLPPVKSGISDYTEDIIRALAEYCDIDAVIDDGYEASSVFPENVRIISHSDYAQNRSSYTQTVYQMGNSEYHFYMYPYIRKYGGIVVLHDGNLHAALRYYCSQNGSLDTSLYEKIMKEDYSDDTAESYIAGLSERNAGTDIYDIVLNGYVCNYADRVIVHSMTAQRQLLECNISARSYVIPHYAMINPLSDAAQCRKENGFEEDIIQISAFGFVHETKRILPILKAFSKLYSENPKVRLLFAGKLSDSIKDEYNRYISDNGLSEAVKLTGFIDIEDFKKYIDMTDICLNLRFPSNGETSGSLMRIFSRGKCVMVNDIGSFSEFPDDICVRIPSVEKTGEAAEPELIYRELKRLTDSPELFRKKGEAARRYAEEYLDINKIAAQYMEVIESKSVPSETVNEKLICTLRNDSNFRVEDIYGISETLAYVKGWG